MFNLKILKIRTLYGLREFSKFSPAHKVSILKILPPEKILKFFNVVIGKF